MAMYPTTASNFPGGFNNVTIRGIPLTQSHPGQVFWVGNSPNSVLPGQVAASDGNPGSFNAPFATLQFAVSRCVEHRGDIIFIKPGHQEIISSATANVDSAIPGGGAITAGALSLYHSGVAIIGLGSGAARPTFTFTAAAASILLGGTPASVTASIAAGATQLVVTVVGSGTLTPGQNIYGAGIQSGLYITSQASGTTGGVGTYNLSGVQSTVFASGTVLATQGVNVGIQNVLFQANFAAVASVFSATALSLPKDFTVEKCEFRDLSSALNFLTIVTQPATTANSLDGLTFDGNMITSLGTTALTTAIKLVAVNDRISARDNYGTWAAGSTAPSFIAATAAITNFDFGRNKLVHLSTGAAGNTIVGVTGSTGICYDNYLPNAAAASGIWITAGTGLTFVNNYSYIAYVADKNAALNPVAV